jgi:hypothetical protein
MASRKALILRAREAGVSKDARSCVPRPFYRPDVATGRIAAAVSRSIIMAIGMR